MRRCPKANPAIVAISNDTGTTPRTIRMLDLSSAPMLAALKRRRSCPTAGASAIETAAGRSRTDAAPSTKRLMNGSRVTAMSSDEQPAADQASRRETIIDLAPSRATGSAGRRASTRTMSDTASAEASPICALGEGEMVDLEARAPSSSCPGRRCVEM